MIVGVVLTLSILCSHTIAIALYLIGWGLVARGIASLYEDTFSESFDTARKISFVYCGSLVAVPILNWLFGIPEGLISWIKIISFVAEALMVCFVLQGLSEEVDDCSSDIYTIIMKLYMILVLVEGCMAWYCYVFYENASVLIRVFPVVLILEKSMVVYPLYRAKREFA